MASEYKIIYKGGEGELVEKKSRFIATTIPVNTEEEALTFIEAIRKKYWDARHNCFAYVAGKNNELVAQSYRYFAFLVFVHGFLVFFLVFLFGCFSSLI